MLIPNMRLTSIPVYWGWTNFTPTIPKLYWDVYSQEERIKRICKELHKLMEYANMLGKEINIDREVILQLLQDFEDFKNGAYSDFYLEQVEQWIKDNMERIISEAIKMVFFGLTKDGYFCAYIPKSWAGITFDTIMDYSDRDYGSLVLYY